MERLIGAILIKAIQDWDDSEFQGEIKEFVRSKWFDILIEGIELDPENVRTQFMNRGYKRVSMRAAYR